MPAPPTNGGTSAAPSASGDRSDLLEIGYVRRAHGVRGALHVQLHDPQSTALERVARIFVAQPKGNNECKGEGKAQGKGEGKDRPARELRVRGAQALSGGAFVLGVEGIDDRDAAEALQGATLLAVRADLGPLEEDELYVADLIGCAAVREDGMVLGQVTAVPNLAGQDLLALALPGGGEALVPYVPALVLAVDLDARRVVLDPPEGLLELEAEPPRPRPQRGRSTEKATATRADAKPAARPQPKPAKKNGAQRGP